MEQNDKKRQIKEDRKDRELRCLASVKGNDKGRKEKTILTQFKETKT